MHGLARSLQNVFGELVIPAPVHSRSGGPGNGGAPSKQEEVVTAKRASVGDEDKVQKSLDGILNADASEIDRSAMRAARGKSSHCISIH
jgi:hypothetical protein